MLLTVAEFRDQVARHIEELVENLQSLTGREGPDEADAWRASLPKLADAIAAPELANLHVYFGGSGNVAVEYQLPAASAWCDAVLLGRRVAVPAAVVVELKNWVTRADRPGPFEGLMIRAGQTALHPADQVRGYVEYCRRFHSTILDREATVDGCVLFTRDRFLGRYEEPPNDKLVKDFPLFASGGGSEDFSRFLARLIDEPDPNFATRFVDGGYRQDRGFVRQIGEQILHPNQTPFELLDNQRSAFALVRGIVENNVLSTRNPRKQVIIIEGPPGSGKSVVAARLWAALVTDERLDDGSVVVVTTSVAQRSVWSSLFKGVGGAAAGGVVKGSNNFVPISTQTLGRLRRKHGVEFADDADDWRSNVELLRDRGVEFQKGAADDEYLVSIVDEAHALINPEHVEGRGQFGFAPTLGPLAWHIIRASTVSVFLLDPKQGFRDRENTTVDDIKGWAAELGAGLITEVSLKGAQFRCAGSTEYVEWVEGVLRGDPPEDLARLAKTWREVFDFQIVETPAELDAKLSGPVKGGRTARLLASYARKLKTKGAARPHALPAAQKDFHERFLEEGKPKYWSKVWNYVPRNGTDYTWFIQAPKGSPLHDDPLCEVGCPYAVRGFDFDYVGVLWLSDFVRRDGAWRAMPEAVHDTGLNLSQSAARRERDVGGANRRLSAALGQAYRILLTRGLAGCYLWIEDPETRAHVRRCLA